MTQGDYAHNAYAREQRAQKAIALVAYLRDAEHVWTRGDLFGDADQEAHRRAVERAAGVRRSSDETWAQVDQLLAQPPAPPLPPEEIP